jgi:7,8-dihydropterin-6-yl-methyl-4-(beta-D-ribofuranosyl)aminobenzene 5'-phosphate synthase
VTGALLGLLLAAAPPGPPVRSLHITILSTMLADTGIGEWGFAALVEVDGHRILFDTGARPDTVKQNAHELGIDLASVRDVVLSHNHDDHVGGLLSLRRDVRGRQADALARVHVAPGMFWSRPSPLGEERNVALGLRSEYESLGGDFVEHKGLEAIFPGVWVTGPVPRVYPERNWSRDFGLANLLGAHCTGIEAVYVIRDRAGLSRKTAVVGAVGASFDLEKGIDPLSLAR